MHPSNTHADEIENTPCLSVSLFSLSLSLSLCKISLRPFSLSLRRLFNVFLSLRCSLLNNVNASVHCLYLSLPLQFSREKKSLSETKLSLSTVFFFFSSVQNPKTLSTQKSFSFAYDGALSLRPFIATAPLCPFKNLSLCVRSLQLSLYPFNKALFSLSASVQHLLSFCVRSFFSREGSVHCLSLSLSLSSLKRLFLSSLFIE
ncbi:MSH4 [Acanthosepion pharaonis]|uniref:MSH4 n=1 Tax=Acanthosepion pharaonis TaxID=158019 RepID=A0A812C6R6_ACAPH|nr:MSH4 [Sepia pharaonis]